MALVEEAEVEAASVEMEGLAVAAVPLMAEVVVTLEGADTMRDLLLETLSRSTSSR